MSAYACYLIGRMLLSLWTNLPEEEQAYVLAKLALEQGTKFECHQATVGVVEEPQEGRVYFFLFCPKRET